MEQARAEAGYALLAVLLVVALAATLVAAMAAAFSAGAGVRSADRDAVSAEAAWREAFAAVSLALRRQPDVQTFVLTGRSSEGDAWEAACAPASGAPGAWPAVQADIASRHGLAARGGSALLSLTADPRAAGCVCAGDVTLAAPLRIGGTGLVCGGSVFGREWVQFGDGAGSAALPPDAVHGDLWPVAAAHAGAGVWAAGVEEHAAQAVARRLNDTDVHAGGSPPQALVELPDAAWAAEFAAGAVAPGEAFRDGVLDLSALPAHAPGATADAGFAVAVGASRVIVVGSRPHGWCRISVLCLGDAVLGSDAGATSLAGALVVLGSCTVAGAAEITGHLFTGALTVAAGLTVDVPARWRSLPCSGLAQPVATQVTR
jgi:hypothetical protein